MNTNATSPLVTKSRKLYLDVARTIAIISISLNHAANRTYENYNGQQAEFYDSSIFSSLIKTVATVFSRIGVPLFLMITGVLILNKVFENGNDIKKFYKNNYLGMLITTEIWYVIMYWVIVLFNPSNMIIEEHSILGVLRYMIKTMFFIDQVTLGSMWYMPMILCLYLILPFFAVIVQKFPKKYIAIPLAVTFITFMCLPAFNQLLIFIGIEPLITGLDSMNLPSLYLIYIFIGYLIGKYSIPKLKSWMVLLLFFTTFGSTCLYQLYAYAQPEDYLVAYSSPGILISAALLFDFIKRKEHWFEKFAGMFTYISKIAFAIYFVHIIIVQLIVWNYDFNGWIRSVQMLFIEVTSVGGSIIIIALLSKIKVLKKYLFMIK